MFRYFSPTQIIPISSVTFQWNSTLMKLNSDAIKWTQFFCTIFDYIFICIKLAKRHDSIVEMDSIFVEMDNLMAFSLLIYTFYELTISWRWTVLINVIRHIVISSKRCYKNYFYVKKTLLLCFYKICILHSSVDLKDTVDSWYYLTLELEIWTEFKNYYY